MLVVRKPLRVVLIAALVTGVTLPSPLVGGVIASLNDSANDVGNHRMEQAIAIGDSVFGTASQDDYVEVALGNNGLGSEPDYGETIRAYLYKDVTYRASVGAVTTSDGTRTFAGGGMTDSVLSMVADKSGSGTSTVGLSTAANGLNFDYAANNYSVVASDDDSIPNAPGASAFMSQLQFTVSQTGYHYFYVSEWNVGLNSSTADGTFGYASTGGTAQQDCNGTFLSTGIDQTPTGSVLGGINAASTTTFYLMHLAGDTPTTSSGGSVVPEPSSLAIFSVLGIAAFNRTRRSKKSASNDI